MSKSLFMTAATAFLVTTATVSTADTFFGLGANLESGNLLRLGTITADADGFVEVYDYHRGAVGALLGVEDIHFGANTDVRVHTQLPVYRNVIAMVRIGNQVVAEKAFDVVD
jgi:hypothetical protein